mgnify:CR=1 FL=1
MFQRDYMLRMIEAVAQAIGRVMRLLAQKKPDEAEQALAEAYNGLSIDKELLLMLDGRSLRAHFGEPDKLVLAARVLICDAEVQLHKAELRAAAKRLKAAQRLLTEHGAPPAEVSAELARVHEALASRSA